MTTETKHTAGPWAVLQEECDNPVAKRLWNVALKVQIEHPPAGAVESWAQFIGQSLWIDLQQDPDLFERTQ